MIRVSFLLVFLVAVHISVVHGLQCLPKLHHNLKAPTRNQFLQHAISRPVVHPGHSESFSLFSTSPKKRVVKEEVPWSIARTGTAIKTVWDFGRPHTLIGSSLSIIALFLFAVPKAQWTQPTFWKTLAGSLFPSLCMNLFITGLNQVTDIKIDKINKPYLPIASGALSKSTAIRVLAVSLFLALANVFNMHWPLSSTLLGCFVLGTIYSVPPFRLKRFPLLAAL
jgi:hypothetical protein